MLATMANMVAPVSLVSFASEETLHTVTPFKPQRWPFPVQINIIHFYFGFCFITRCSAPPPRGKTRPAHWSVRADPPPTGSVSAAPIGSAAAAAAPLARRGRRG